MKEELAKVMLDTIEAMTRDAYLRGTVWRDENPGHVNSPYRFKAARDYADEVTSAGRQFLEGLSK